MLVFFFFLLKCRIENILKHQDMKMRISDELPLEDTMELLREYHDTMLERIVSTFRRSNIVILFDYCVFLWLL